jgi:hypothetical protein
MADYKAMYAELFQAQTRAIVKLEGVVDALKTAQQTTEGMYMDAESVILEMKKPESKEDGGDESE